MVSVPHVPPPRDEGDFGHGEEPSIEAAGYWFRKGLVRGVVSTFALSLLAGVILGRALPVIFGQHVGDCLKVEEAR